MSLDVPPRELVAMLDESAASIPQYREMSLYALAARAIEKLIAEKEELKRNLAIQMSFRIQP